MPLSTNTPAVGDIYAKGTEHREVLAVCSEGQVLQIRYQRILDASVPQVYRCSLRAWQQWISTPKRLLGTGATVFAYLVKRGAQV